MGLFSPGARLLKVIEFIGETDCIIDVGSDHGRLPAWLILNNRIKTAYATDISQSSVVKINNLAHRFELEGRLFGKQCDGLQGFDGHEADTVTICGMGGETICGILKDAHWTADGKHRIIIQCMSSFDVLNDFLKDSCFDVLDEAIVKESGRLYDIVMICGKAGHINGDITLPSEHILSSQFAKAYIQRKIAIKNSELDGILCKYDENSQQATKIKKYLDYYNKFEI